MSYSIFGLGFGLHDAARPIPTHILVYDRDNRVIKVDSLDRLCLVALDLGSNYDLPHTDVKAAIEHALRCDWKPRLDHRTVATVVPDSAVQSVLHSLST